MIHILHGFSNVDSEFKPRNLRQEGVVDADKSSKNMSH